MTTKKLKVLVIGAIVTGIIGLGFDFVKNLISQQEAPKAIPVVVLTPTPSQQSRPSQPSNTPKVVTLTPSRLQATISSQASEDLWGAIDFLKTHGKSDTAEQQMSVKFGLYYKGTSFQPECNLNWPGVQMDPDHPNMCLYPAGHIQAASLYLIRSDGAYLYDGNYRSGIIITNRPPKSISLTDIVVPWSPEAGWNDPTQVLFDLIYVANRPSGLESDLPERSVTVYVILYQQ